MTEATKPILLFFIALVVCNRAYAADSETAVPLRGITSSTSEAVPQNNNVESFFQIDPIKRNSAQNLLMQPEPVASSTENKSKSLSHHIYRCFWHVFDNAGVPMFFGQDTSYIDPSINDTYLIPSPKLPRERAAVTLLEETTRASKSPPLSAAPNSSSANSELMPQKIPKSELEGVPLPTLRDDVHAPAP